jgi:hypothetical protein
VFVPICRRARRLLDRLRQAGPSQGLLRALQPYSVAVYERAFQELRSSGAVEEFPSGFHALHQAPGPHYHPDTGFTSRADATALLMA